MIAPRLARKTLDAALAGGADFAEIFVEDTFSSRLSLVDAKPDSAMVGRRYGCGVRLFYGTEQIYVTTNDLSENGLIKAAGNAAMARKSGAIQAAAPSEFSPLRFDEIHRYGTRPSAYELNKKLSFLQRVDTAARKRSSMVVQASPWLLEKTQKILIANSEGLWAEDERNNVNTGVEVILEDQGARESGMNRDGSLATSEFFETFDFESLAHTAVDLGKLLIHADYAPAGEFPVILDAGFGGVIFHEACGHGLETTSVARNASVFCGKMNQKIAESCVTAIDDGTLANTWGSLNIDDEGRRTQRTVLIENGILKSYLVDTIGAKQTEFAPTGSGRRESYKFMPTSRMRNTYLAAGTSSLDEMIRDVDFGIYAKRMGGGSVNPGTGDYNFGVREAYIIRGGKLCEPVKGVTLIGRGIETLGRIVKVGTDMRLEIGMCGSVSGQIPTTVGQPAILVSKITVGGRAK